MPRWSAKIEDSIQVARKFDTQANLMKNFFMSRVYTPENEKERMELEEFSMVTSAMALMIHVAEADKIVKPEERNRIIDDLIFQLEQRTHEYAKLSEQFGKTERKIIENMFDKLLNDYEKDRLKLDDTINIINMVFKNNPYSKHFLIRLCYYCAYSDKQFDENEKIIIDKLATKLNVEPLEKERIEKEVRFELRKQHQANTPY